VNSSKEILKKYWGFTSFRPQQEEIVDDVINGHDVLALLPTGGGKSICFQVPGIAREGITLVISPLIALMQDQVQNLRKNGIKAIAITSAMSSREIDIALDNVKFGGFDFLYTSPERIRTPLFIARFKQMNVGLIVVDEAHCISEWGHDFRPSYFSIFELRKLKPNIPMMALTATATKNVQLDIIEKLDLKNVRLHEASFLRENLSYNVFKVSNKLEYLLSFCIHNKSVGIIYCQTRKSVKEVAKKLIAHNVSCGIYHGGMGGDERATMLNNWLSESITVMVATNAFGMGIDKANVRFVLHYEVPNSLEAYFQEAGRAGRDGKTSQAIALITGKETAEFISQLETKFPLKEKVLHSYVAMCNYLRIAIGSALNETYPIDLKQICQAYELDYITVYNSIKILETAGYFSFSEGFHSPTKLMVTIDHLQVYNFQIQHPNFQEILSLLSRMNSNIFENFQEIREDDIAKKLKKSKKEVINLLESLMRFGVLEIKWNSDLPMITFLRERCTDKDFSLPHAIYKDRKKQAEERMNAMINFLDSPICRSQIVLEYFGQNSHPCGICNNCTKEAISLKDDTVLEFLKNEKTIFDLCEYFSSDEESINLVLRKLLTEEIIRYNGKGYVTVSS
jgi:ATP-dependent DNA helicase RecQ